MSDPVLTLRATLANLSRWRPDDDPELSALRLELRHAKLERAIRRELATAPPLTYRQRAQLAGLLLPGSSHE